MKWDNFERTVSKINYLALNKLVTPHLVHQGQFWPSKAIFGSKFAILSFGAFLAPKISNKRAAYFFLIPLAFLHLI